MKRFTFYTLLILFIPVLLMGCAKKPETIYSEPPPVDRKDIKPTPTEVVTEFLNAIKNENYAKAYQYVNVPYTDRSGYINQMKNMVSDNNLSLVSYRMLATQIYDRTSTVVVELSTKLKSPKTGSLIDLTQKSQYSLGLFEEKWLITADSCIEGCIEREPVIEVIE